VAEPVSPVGQTRLASEHLYLRLYEERGADVRICRVPGIYGPGRTLRDRLEGGPTGGWTTSSSGCPAST
jgi:nucleoside-diphosphate-sugar epimerase